MVLSGCTNKFGIRSEMFASKASYVYKKIVFCSKKLLFQPFLWTAKNDNGFVSNFSPISNNLLNKLLHKIIGAKMLKNSIFNSCSSQKRLKKQFFGAKYIFFVNYARFALKHIWAYSKLVRTPSRFERGWIFFKWYKGLKSVSLEFGSRPINCRWRGLEICDAVCAKALNSRLSRTLGHTLHFTPPKSSNTKGKA